MYCPNCYLLVNDKKCPVCGSKNLREPVSDDYCFLVEKELIWASALEDLLMTTEYPLSHEMPSVPVLQQKSVLR